MIIEKESPLYPECLKQFDAKIFVGGCISRGEGSRFRAKAHAHLSYGNPNREPNPGWICFLSAKRLSSKELCLHEMAHILTNNFHTKKWREKLLEIGGTLDEVPGILRSYQPKRRCE